MEILQSLDVPAEAEWSAIYRRFYGLPSPLPFPLGQLVQGLYKTRKDPGTYIRSLNWFFEATYRFLLALVLRPYIQNVPIDKSLWGFFDSVLGMGGDRNVSLGGWRDFAFDCLARVVEHPKALGEVPLFLKGYTGRSGELERLRSLNDVVVHFRNLIEHGVRDGNAPGFERADAALYERALIRLLLDLEPLRSYSLIMYSAEEDAFEEVSIGGQLQPLEAAAVARDRFVFSSLNRAPYKCELLLASWLPDRRRIDAAWSMHPFLTITPRTDSSGGPLQARLFERFVSSPPPRVIFDLANLAGPGDATCVMKKADDEDPALVELVRALVKILNSKRISSARQAVPTELGGTLAEIASVMEREDAQRVAEREAEATRRRDMFARRIGYRPDPFFKGRQTELEQLVQGLNEKKSLQIRSVIWGMGGVGKTALAVQLCHQLIARDVFADGILWYRVRQESVAEVIKRCTIDLDIDPDVNAMTDMDARIAEFQHRLRKLDLLVVLDNADYGPEVMRPIFDLFRGIPLLITSRREFDLPGSIRVPLGDLKPEDAVALVRDLLGMGAREATQSGLLGTEADIDELCRAVGCLPIALVLAAAYIRERRLPIRRYIATWHSRRDRLRLLSADRIDEKEEKLRDVRACFGMSFDDLDTRAKRLLAYMGLWEGRDFSLAHLSSVIDETVYPNVDGHDGALTIACELPGGTLGVTGGEDGRVLVWDLSDRRRPRALLTVFQCADPIADLVVGPNGRQFLIQTDAGSIAMVPLVDVPAFRVAKASVLGLQNGESHFKDRVDLVMTENGIPAVESREDRLQFRLKLPWPSPESPKKPPAVEMLCEVVSSGANDFSQPHADPEWRRRISNLSRPRPCARPDIETLDRIARNVLGRVKTPVVPEPHTARETSLFAQATRGRYESGPAWAVVTMTEEVSEGLAAMSVVLQQRSLADKVRADDSERVRVHPLVSEFAAEQLSAEDRDRAVPAIFNFYLERMRSNRRHFDADEANIEFSLIWALQNWTPERLTADNVLSSVADALQYRGRYSLALQWSGALVRAAEQNGADKQAGRAWARHAMALFLCGRKQESSKAQSRSRELLERASTQQPILAELINDLWWMNASIDNERWEGSLARNDAGTETSRRLRQARTSIVDTYWWIRSTAHDWADWGSWKVVAAKEEITANALWNRRNCIERFAKNYGDVEDLFSAHDQLLALTRDSPSENILETAYRLRLSAFLAAGDPLAASLCLETLRKLVQRMPPEATRFDLLLAEAQIDLRHGKSAEARLCWERARPFLERPTNGTPDSWFWEAYFQLADGCLQPAVKVLQEVRRFWPSLASHERDHYHRLSAWTLVLRAIDDTTQARLAWARAEVYNRRFATVAPWQRKTWVELYAAGSDLQIKESEVSEADEAIWGPPAERPYVLVRGPNVEFEELPPESKPDAKPKVLGLVEPLHLRNRPATVGELRAYCDASGTPLPWYYRAHRPDAADSDWAIFVPYEIALRLAEHIDEGLPGTLGWGALPEDPAWRLPIPARSTLFPEAASIDEWVEQSPAWLTLTENLLRPGEIAPDDLPLVRTLLCADPVSALDKWRVVEIVRSTGFAALPPRLRKLVDIAATRRVPLPLTPEVLSRLERDWRSLGHLAGIAEVTPDAAWLRPEMRKANRTFGTVEHMGAIGVLTRAGTLEPSLLVPDACAWADVLVWPSRLFDPTWYCEEAPPWP